MVEYIENKDIRIHISIHPNICTHTHTHMRAHKYTHARAHTYMHRIWIHAHINIVPHNAFRDKKTINIITHKTFPTINYSRVLSNHF